VVAALAATRGASAPFVAANAAGWKKAAADPTSNISNAPGLVRAGAKVATAGNRRKARGADTRTDGNTGMVDKSADRGHMVWTGS
jgi:hypothetical protein